MEGKGIDDAGCDLYKIVSTSNQGNYTKIVDECGNDALVHTNQWNEYQLMLQQGSPEVVAVFIGWSDETFYAISGYQLAGQEKVKLPKDKQIKITDTYNCDHLTVLKSLGNTLGSAYLFNQIKEEKEIKENNARIDAQIAAEAAKQRAEAQRSAEESARNAQINAEMWTHNDDKYHITTQLPYTTDHMSNYAVAELKKSQEKLWASFDNERNYVQQWLDRNGFNSIPEFYDKIAHDKDLWDTGYDREGMEKDNELSKKYNAQLAAARVYIRDTGNGTLPSNCSMGDWIRHNLKKSAMGGWNGIAMWVDDTRKIDFTPITKGAKFNGFALYEDIARINLEIYEMIRKDFTTIANYKVLTKADCIGQVEQLTDLMITPIATTTLAKEVYPEYQSPTELHKKLAEEFATKYLPNMSQEPGNLDGLTEYEKELYKLK